MIIGIDASRTTVDQQTGTESYATNLIRSLIGLLPNDRSIQLKLYFNQGPASGLFEPHVAVKEVVIPFHRMWTHIRLASELQMRPPDVFFTPAHVIPYSYNRPSVATVHDLGYHYFPEAHPRSQLSYLKWSTRHNAERSNHILADSLATKRDLTHFHQIPSEKIDVVYPALDPEFEREISQTGRLFARPQHPYLLFLSTIQPRKNVARIIDAFVQASPYCPHNLIIAGRIGWQAEPILHKIKSLDQEIQNRIFMPGYISKEGKVPLIAGADALIYPSLYEGFGFPVLEANACGTAVIASNTSSLVEVGTNGAARLVDPLNTDEIRDAILDILSDSSAREQLIRQGYKNVQRFTWARAAQQTLDILTTVAQNGR